MRKPYLCCTALKVHHMYNNNGFTIMELMITVSIAAIIMATAVPSMQIMNANARTSSVANDLASDLKKARNMAVVARRNHTFAAVDSSVSTNIWGNEGWQVTEVVAGVTQVVFANRTVPQGMVVNSTLSSIRFSAATGMVQNAAGDTVSVTFRVCDAKSSKETGFDVSINPFGRVLVQKHEDLTTCNP